MTALNQKPSVFRLIQCASLLVLVGVALSFLLVAPAGYSQAGYGGRPPQFTPAPPPATFEPSTPVAGNPTPVLPKNGPRFMPASLFGMNLYLTGLERSEAESSLLGGMAEQDGVKWSREELSWANIEPTVKGQFNWAPYDHRLAFDTANHIEVIGMLLTTPRWSTTNPNAPD